MQRPTGVAALPNGNYVVADYENKWVSVFEPSGKYITRLGHGKLLGESLEGGAVYLSGKCMYYVISPLGSLSAQVSITSWLPLCYIAWSLVESLSISVTLVPCVECLAISVI